VRVLFVDDSPALRKAVRRLMSVMPETELLEADSYESAIETTTKEALDLLLIDVCLSTRPNDRGGLDLLRELKRRGYDAPSVIVTSSNQMEDLREAMRLGAKDYILKDELSAELLLPILEGFRERAVMRGELRKLRVQADATFGADALVGTSKPMREVRNRIRRVADADETVLIRGETGTGKELVARALHQESKRRDEPFVAINCSAVPANLLESILFGHEKGSFTGADRQRRGRLQMAGSGTVLLDEIADMPLDLQVKLLRVLEDGRFLPIGADREISLHARIVAATNGNLEALADRGRFRIDLLYRLDVVSVHLPSLAERGEDLIELLLAFTSNLERRVRYTDAALEWLTRRRWTGNVRELRNAVLRVSLLSEHDVIDVPELMKLLDVPRGRDAQATIDRLADEVLALPEQVGSRAHHLELTLVRRAMELTKGNKSSAARLVGIDRQTFKRKLARINPSIQGDEDDDIGED